MAEDATEVRSIRAEIRRVSSGSHLASGAAEDCVWVRSGEDFRSKGLAGETATT